MMNFAELAFCEVGAGILAQIGSCAVPLGALGSAAPTRANTAHRAVRDAAEKNGGFLLRMETKAVHAGRGVDPATGAVTPPIHLSTTFERDADLVMHATTKYLGGHSDVMGGVVVAKSDDGPFRRIRKVQHSGGAIPSPFECWLTLRGIQTLPYRM